jgi:hypothetical protein
MFPRDPESPGATAATLDAELRARLIRRLAKDWEDLNWNLFGDSLRAPLFELTDGTSCLATWKGGAERTIAFSRHGMLDRPWAQVVELLKHEMAHQFVDEVLGGEERPHGPLFRQVCAQRGIDAAAAGLPNVTKAEGDRPEDRAIARVRKLLALAQSANRNEAELAAATAQRIMIKHNLGLPKRHDPGDDGTYGCAWVGKPTGRVQAHHRALARLLTEHFFVDGIWMPVYRPREDKTGQVLEIVGRRENLQMAEYVHAFLEAAVERLWKAHKRETGIRSNRGRRTFLVGALEGFAHKLRSQRDDVAAEGLVLAHDPSLEAFFRRRNPRVQVVRRAGVRRTQIYEAGKSAGESIVLSQPLHSTARDGDGPRALAPPRPRRP